MKCPRCETVLDERDREGVVVDVCTSCRGIWLDRGELEKLILRAEREFEEGYRDEDRARPPAPPPQQREKRYDTPPKGFRRDEGYGKRGHYKSHHKPGWMRILKDVFD